VTNAGKSGITTLNWWLTKKDAYNYADYDTFIIWLGTNEGLTDTLAADTASGNYLTYDDTNTGAYCKIIEHIKAANPKANIFLLNLYASSGDLTVSNNVLNQIASKYSLSLFAMNDGELSSSIYHPFSNTVHFGKHGNLAVAKKVSKYINQYISDNPAQFEETYLP
jgi:hypothetical protein